MEDGGKYSLVAENKNGRDVVDLDLIVVDEVPVGDCDMFLHGTLECRCHLRYRTETSEMEMARIAGAGAGPNIVQSDTAAVGVNDKKFSPKMLPINNDISLYGVVGGMEVGMKPNCDLNLLTDNVRRNIDVMFIKH